MIIDPEFQAIGGKLQGDEYEQLRDNLLRDGCRDPLVLWHEQRILLDGHNRREICEQHRIPYRTTTIQLPDRAAAKVWIIHNQFGRRNLTPYRRAEMALELESLIAAKAKENQQTAGRIGASMTNRGCQISDNLDPVDTKKEVAREAGLSHDTIAKAKYLRDHADEDTKVRLRKGETNIHAEYCRLRREESERQRDARREANAEQIAEAPSVQAAVTAGARFATIVADPPWDWGDEGDADQFGRARPTYGTMPFEDLLKLPVGNLADQDCHLYLWITNRSLPKGFLLLERWGFRYITTLTWCKPSFGMGNYFRGSTEQVLFGVRGSQLLKRQDVGTWFTAPRGPLGHSSKPTEFYNLVESCSPGPYLEMFARSPRAGWSAWGAEANVN